MNNQGDSIRTPTEMKDRWLATQSKAIAELERNMTPKIEAHLKGDGEMPTHYKVFHDGVDVGNITDPDANIEFLLDAARRGVGPTRPSEEWTRTLVALHNRVAQVDADRAALREPEASTDDEGLF